MEVRFYESVSGRSPVREFVDSLSYSDSADIYSCIIKIKIHGFDANGVEFRQIDGKLREIKIRCIDGSYRLFYVTLKGNTMIILHGYRKQSQKAPAKELKIAKQRMKEVLYETSYYRN